MKEKIDIDKWKRKRQFTFFSNFTNPYASITSQVNIDNLVKYSKENKVSFYGLMSYIVTKTINEIDEFKYILEEDGVYKYDKMNISFANITDDYSLNFSRTVEYNDMDTFLSDFEYAKNECASNVKIPYDRDKNKIYITCVPWMRFSSVENPINGIDSNPRICWGKYFLENDEYKIDISVQINHAFQDGYHLGMFFNKLQDNINNIKVEKNEKSRTLHRS